MQATLMIDDDLLTEAERLATERSISVDVVISDLLRQSLMRIPIIRPGNGFRIVSRVEGGSRITNEDIRRADEDI